MAANPTEDRDIVSVTIGRDKSSPLEYISRSRLKHLQHIEALAVKMIKSEQDAHQAKRDLVTLLRTGEGA